MVKFTYDGGEPVILDNVTLMWREAMMLEKVTGRRIQEFMKAFWEMGTEEQGVMYWFAIYREKGQAAAGRLSEFDFDISKLTVEIELPDQVNPVDPDADTPAEGEAPPDPSPAAAPERSAAEPTAAPI